MIRFAIFILRTFAKKPTVKGGEDNYQRSSRRVSFLPQLIEEGFTVKKLTDYQYRVNEVLDIYPTNAKYHDIKRNKRGSFRGQNVCMFVRKFFKTI